MIDHLIYRRTRRSSVPLFCLLVAGSLAAFWGGCRQKPAGEPTQPAAVTAPKAAASEANQVAATVNGVSISSAQIDSIVEESLRPQADKLSQLPPEFVEQRKKEMRRQILDKRVVECLLDEQVKGLGVTVSDEDLQKKIADIASKQQPPMSSEEFLAKVEASGLTADGFQKELRRDMGYLKLFEGQWAGKTDVNDHDAKAYYDDGKHAEEFKDPEKVRASHILITPAPQASGGDPNQAKALARTKAEDLLSQIRGGADFAELAKANSACPSASKGGDLDYFKREEMDPAFEKVAFELAVGQVSDVVETQFGFHIIKVTDHKAARTLSFEEAKPGIVEKLTTERKTQIVRAYVESLKAKAKIQYGSK